METMKVKWTGTVPMLMHNERLADPLDPHTKALAALTSTRGNAKKTDAHIEDVARAEWDRRRIGPGLARRGMAGRGEARPGAAGLG